MLFAFKFEVGDFGCFDVHFIYKHSKCKHQVEYSSYFLIGFGIGNFNFHISFETIFNKVYDICRNILYDLEKWYVLVVQLCLNQY